MAIDIASEKLIRLSKGAKLIEGGDRISGSTMYRWHKHGLRGVKLEAIRIGGSSFTSVEAIQRFADALTGISPEAAPTLRSPARRRREIEAADRELARMGV
jgi:hypothetical protein